MIIDLTSNDWWREFVFWRRRGHEKLAFDYLRVNQDPEYFEILIAMIARRKYGKKLKIGDCIRLDTIAVKWSWEMEKEFNNPDLPNVLRSVVQ
uniref:Uncharacterized protein n=1 Tax=viral metagenome TaxID=1070528 RepID=A0A6C0CJ05_9ZZZZ